MQVKPAMFGPACCLLAVACGAVPGAEREYYECTLKAALPDGADVILMVSVEGGRIRRHGLMVAGRPDTAQRMKDSRLRVEAGRLTGPVAIEVGPAVHKIDLDVALDKGGTFFARYGCPAAPREVKGTVAVDRPADAGGKQHMVRLGDAFGPGSPLELTLILDRQAKTVQAVRGRARHYNQSEYPLDVSRLTFDGRALAGEVGLTIVPDQWVPAHRQPVIGLVRLEARLDGKDEAGSYSATFGIEKKRPGEAAVRPATEAEMTKFLLLGRLPDQLRTDQAQVVDELTPWRIRLTRGPAVLREDGGLKWNLRSRSGLPTYDPAAPWSTYVEAGLADPLGADDWARPDFDDRRWPRWSNDLFEHFGGYGFNMDSSRRWPVPALLRLRTYFGIADPARTTDLEVTVRCVGGGVVYVNGEEVGRGFMPAGPIRPTSLAAEYPIDAYTADDGQTPLPGLVNPNLPEAKLLPRYRTRVRDFTVRVPPRVLVKGRNVLGVQLHRAAVAGAFGRGGAWSHVGIWQVWATSRSGRGVIRYAEAIGGTRVWSAAATEQVTAELPRKTVLPKNRFWYIYNDAGVAVKGIFTANPYDALLPIRMVAPRNGVCSGQAVVSDPDGLGDLAAAIEDLRGPDGAAIPAAAARIRFAAGHRDVYYCDALHRQPPAGARTVPVWVILKVPAGQQPGWYASTLRIAANGKRFSVPVQVLVSACEVPDPKDNHSNVAMMQSPDSVAFQYKVAPWSEAHFKLLDRSFELLGRLGGDVLYVPVLVGADKGEKVGAIRWVKAADGYRPEFGAFERLIDTYARHCGPPKAMPLCVWSQATAKSVARAYEGSQTASASGKPRRPLAVTLLDAATGEMSDLPAPQYDEEGGEAFWRPMLDGVRRIVAKRGWPERIIMLGEGGDVRPSQQTGEVFRRWAPQARWDILSHFSGDPGSMFYKGQHKEAHQAGRMIATGDLEVGLKEYPGGGPCRAEVLAGRLRRELEYYDLPNHRWQIVRDSPPAHFRTLFQYYEGFSRIGLDFWPLGPRGRSVLSGWTAGSRVRAPVDSVTTPGPDGAEPTVRLQMMREAIQDLEVRIAVLRAIENLPDERRKAYLGLLDGLRAAAGCHYPDYAARLAAAAAELAGAKEPAAWDQPPGPPSN